MKVRVVNGISFRKHGSWVSLEPGSTVDLPPELAELYLSGGDVEKVSEPVKASAKKKAAGGSDVSSR